MPCILEIWPRALPLPEAHNLTRLANPLPDTAHDRFGHALIRTTPSPPLSRAHATDARRACVACRGRSWSDVAASFAGGILGAHARQHVFACRQGDKEGERNEPDAEAKVRCDLGEGGYVSGATVGVGRVGRGGRRRAEVPEPEVVVYDDES